MNIATFVDHNNTTLTYLQEKDYPNAAVSSLSALTHLRASQEVQLHDLQPQRPPGAVDSSLDKCMLLYQDFDEDEAELSSSVVIYHQGILIPSTMVGDPRITTPILIFNSALAHHLSAEASQGAASSPRELNKAKRLYELAYQSQTISENMMFRCAIFNNIAMIDLRLGNEEQSKQYLSLVMSVMMTFVEQGFRVKLRCLQGLWANVCSISQTATAA
ncbi:unnamed protein product [Cylindrotheca closterium]|uniref:Uncharacterized protein n=1 Tax=Cylindrotheca closterium TaxID=2856 RepID=A0AAD2FIQ3_9STRA|nr:unnamed protein product [Cylindrotheca closterium]